MLNHVIPKAFRNIYIGTLFLKVFCEQEDSSAILFLNLTLSPAEGNGTLPCFRGIIFLILPTSMACSGIVLHFQLSVKVNSCQKICWTTFLSIIRTTKSIEIDYQEKGKHILWSLGLFLCKTLQVSSNGLSPTNFPRRTTSFCVCICVLKTVSSRSSILRCSG